MLFLCRPSHVDVYLFKFVRLRAALLHFGSDFIGSSTLNDLKPAEGGSVKN